jgi:2-octaprenyl-6-methoxyphenol hydroxylase
MDRALLADNIPMQATRSLGLFLAGSIAPLRQLMMREGLAPTIGTPRLMRKVAG